MSQTIEFFNEGFLKLHTKSLEMLDLLAPVELYLRPKNGSGTLLPLSTGEYLLRAAAAVEQTAGGITRRLWDDPFEWTLPEKLSTKELVAEYISEVELARREAFQFFASDDDLCRLIPSPDGFLPIGRILTDTIVRASHYQGRAFAAFQLLTGKKPPRF
ncbi:MAG: hypothetical protein AB1477_09495 [Acidobacteriota bacterium]